MEANLICNFTLDGCGILFLLTLLPPFFFGNDQRTTNRRKGNLLLYAAMAHLFALLLRLAGSISVLALSQTGAAGIFTSASVLPLLISVSLLFACILCDENGVIRLRKGERIPVSQIICAVLPSAAACCLMIVVPGVGLMGIAWALALQLNQHLIQIDSMRRIEAAEQRLSRDQALLMTVQMQPHFLFNTLSSIEALCQTDAQAAAESLENLSGYLRGNLDALASEAPIPFDDELRHIRQYIALELADPSRQFRFDYELDVRDFKIPALSIQPIVDNAVKHGALTHRDGTGRVLLSTEAFGETIRVTVTDNGLHNAALTEAQRESRGIGIESTRKRLSALCGGSLQIFPDETGTRAVILIPKKQRG